MLATKRYTSHVQYKVWHAVTQPGVSDIGPEAWTTFLSVIGAPSPISPHPTNFCSIDSSLHFLSTQKHIKMAKGRVCLAYSGKHHTYRTAVLACLHARMHACIAMAAMNHNS
jgi:hypothetical protein